MAAASRVERKENLLAVLALLNLDLVQGGFVRGTFALSGYDGRLFLGAASSS